MKLGSSEKKRLVQEIRDWLGRGGKKFFKAIYSEHGTLIVVLPTQPVPHPVHFREGMQVRNKLRKLTNGSWSAHDYDNMWEEIVLAAIGVQEGDRVDINGRRLAGVIESSL